MKEVWRNESSRSQPHFVTLHVIYTVSEKYCTLFLFIFLGARYNLFSDTLCNCNIFRLFKRVWKIASFCLSVCMEQDRTHGTDFY